MVEFRSPSRGRQEFAHQSGTQRAVRIVHKRVREDTREGANRKSLPLPTPATRGGIDAKQLRAQRKKFNAKWLLSSLKSPGIFCLLVS